MTSTMNSTNIKLVFFGTGPVSLASLEGIHSCFDIEAVITKPDLRTHSGSTIPPAVKTWAESHDVPCFQPADKAGLTECITAQKFTSQFGLVIDYGLIIPRSVIESFKLGIINSHFSLLPKWRGADPITWSILNGDKTTGVTIMKINEGMDTGDVLAQKSLLVADQETTTSLTDKLVTLSNELLIDTLPSHVQSSVMPKPQHHKEATYSSKITKEMGLCDPFKHTASELERQVRAFLGWPGSYMTINGVLLTIKEAQVGTLILPTGTLALRDGKLLLGCKEGSLEIIRIQPAGKKPMDARGFINGYGRLLS